MLVSGVSCSPSRFFGLRRFIHGVVGAVGTATAATGTKKDHLLMACSLFHRFQDYLGSWERDTTTIEKVFVYEVL